jgi:ectoine hydroxylase
MTTTVPAVQHPGTAMTADQRAQFERDGYLVVPGVLDADEVAHYTEAVDRAYERHAPEGGPMHLLGTVPNCPELAPLTDHPAVFGLVWSILGWNVHIYHSHLDVHPTVTGDQPFRYQWHQDGGRQNREIETHPRPRMSVKLTYWLTDVSVPGRGNLKIVPGSHTTDWIAGPPTRSMPWPDPEDAIHVTANAGDAVFLDRRLWHAQSDNHSPITRAAASFAYTYRWVRAREELKREHPGLSPVQQQLLGALGATDGDHAWGHAPHGVPLYTLLRETGNLDPGYPHLKP